MKKILLLVTLVFCVFGLTGCNKYTTYTEISYSGLMEKIDNKDTFAVVFGSSTCSACAKYKINMEKVIKSEQVEIFYVGLDKLSDDDYNKVYSKFVINSTPTTVFFREGVEVSTYNRIVGAANSTEIIKNLKKNGIIGE